MTQPDPPNSMNPFNGSLADELLVHRPWLRTVVLARTRGNVAVTDDLLSDLIAEIVRCPDKLKDVEQLAPWLYRAAINRVTDWLRKEQRTKVFFAQIARDPTITFETDRFALEPIDMLLLNERRQSIRDALATLTDEDVEILTLKYCHAWSYSQLEQHLGIELNLIANRLRTARSRLKVALLQTEHADEFQTLERFTK